MTMKEREFFILSFVISNQTNLYHTTTIIFTRCKSTFLIYLNKDYHWYILREASFLINK